jgi:hypothetical protein
LYNVNEIVYYKLDGTDNPGSAKVKLLKPTFKILGFQCWRVEVIAMVKPSQFQRLKVGVIRPNVSERWFSKVE